MWGLSGGIFMGWALGANDGANVFGTAVASRIISFRTAAILGAGAIIAGAILQGTEGMETISSLSPGTYRTAAICAFCAALTVTLMTVLKLPVSASQALVGAIIGMSLVEGQPNWTALKKVVICWLATPVGAAMVACILYVVLGFIINRMRMSVLTRDNLLWSALVVVGVYGAYALGANNVANVTGIYYGIGTLGEYEGFWLTLIGGTSIALGTATFGKRVMMTVGAKLVQLDAYAALIAVLSQAVTVHFFAIVGVPVSTSQAVIGGVVGVGLMRGATAISPTVLKNILMGWFTSPLVAAILAALAKNVFG